MKLQNKNIKRFAILSILIITILLMSGCNKEQKASLEKTIIPDVKNMTDTTEMKSEPIVTESISSENITSEAVKTETVTDEQLPYVRPFDAYILQNKDFIGWIKINGTSIDDPIVQGDDNAHYLDYDYTGAKNYAGAIFLDYKNQGNFYDNHMSLYAHYMEDGSMFYDLHKYKDANFLKTYPEITLGGLRETKDFVIFSVHIVSAYDYYLYLDLDDDALIEYAEHFKRQSMHDTSATFPEDLKLLTLVTCTYEFENARLLIHAYQK